MNISTILYDLSGQKIPLSEALSSYVPRSELMVFEKMMKLKQVVRNEGKTHKDQLVTLLQKFFLSKSSTTKKIDYIFYAHTADDVAPIEDQILYVALKEFALNDIPHFGVTLHKCASVFQLLVFANKLLNKYDEDSSILILVTDLSFTKILTYIPGSTVLSDGGLLLEVSKNVGCIKILDIEISEFGEFSEVNTSKESMLQFQKKYPKNIIETISSLLKRHALSTSSISCLCPHNVNFLSWKEVSTVLNIPMSKIYSKNIPLYGHCFGIDPFVNLAEAIREGVIGYGELALLVTVGLGASFSAMLVRC